MGVILKVGEHADFPPIPQQFPTCGDWIPSKTVVKLPKNRSSKQLPLGIEYLFLFSSLLLVSTLRDVAYSDAYK